MRLKLPFSLLDPDRLVVQHLGLLVLDAFDHEVLDFSTLARDLDLLSSFHVLMISLRALPHLSLRPGPRGEGRVKDRVMIPRRPT